MFCRIKLHVDAEDLREIRLRKDLVPFCIHDLPFSDQVHLLRRAVNDLVGGGFTVQREQTLADFVRGKHGHVFIGFLTKAKESHLISPFHGAALRSVPRPKSFTTDTLSGTM